MEEPWGQRAAAATAALQAAPPRPPPLQQQLQAVLKPASAHQPTGVSSAQACCVASGTGMLTCVPTPEVDGQSGGRREEGIQGGWEASSVRCAVRRHGPRRRPPRAATCTGPRAPTSVADGGAVPGLGRVQLGVKHADLHS